jgi:hypothetical protein
MAKRTIEQAYADVLRSVEQRAKIVSVEKRRQLQRQKLIDELARLATKGLELAKAGKEKEAHAVLRKAQILEAKLKASSSKL